MTDMNMIKRILTIVSLLITLAGCIFLGISIFGGVSGTGYLNAALGCILLGNLFNIIRMQFDRNEQGK